MTQKKHKSTQQTKVISLSFMMMMCAMSMLYYNPHFHVQCQNNATKVSQISIKAGMSYKTNSHNNAPHPNSMVIIGQIQQLSTSASVHTHTSVPNMRKIKELMKQSQFNSAIEMLLAILKMELKWYFQHWQEYPNNKYKLA